MLMKYDHVFSNIFIFLFISKNILLVTAVNSASNNVSCFYFILYTIDILIKTRI